MKRLMAMGWVLPGRGAGSSAELRTDLPRPLVQSVIFPRASQGGRFFRLNPSVWQMSQENRPRGSTRKWALPARFRYPGFPPSAEPFWSAGRPFPLPRNSSRTSRRPSLLEPIPLIRFFRLLPSALPARHRAATVFVSVFSDSARLSSHFSHTLAFCHDSCQLFPDSDTFSSGLCSKKPAGPWTLREM